MTDKQRVRRTLSTIQKIKTWQLVVLLILACFLAATFLRLNNIGMVQRRDALIAADQTGDADVIANRLLDLQQYVTSHMNTDLGKGVPLQASYDRAVEKMRQEALADNNANGNIYKLADDYCKPQFSAYSSAYLQCFLGQLDKYPASDALKADIKRPNAALYMHNFVSPIWSPDWAGFAVLIAILIALVLLGRLIGTIVLRIMLRWHYRTI